MSNTTFTDNLSPFSGSTVNVISNPGGDINLTGGTGGDINLTTNTSGNIAITSGNSVTATQGGSVNITSGNNTSTGDGGEINLIAGNSSTGVAGDVNVTSGSSASATKGGSINITSGANSSTGDGGDVIITAGVPTTGTQGTITFSALGSAGASTPVPFNDTVNTTLTGFSATSMIGALNELATTNASNLGAGEGVFASKVGTDLQFKSLVVGTNMSISSDPTEVTIETTGEPNTASNLGAGEGVFAGKVLEDLQFKSLVAGTNMSINSDPTEVTINSLGSPNTEAVVATTTNGTLATDFENGDTVDGVVLTTGDTILIKNQTNAIENGLYSVEATGAPTRVLLLNGNNASMFVTKIRSGTQLGNIFICSNTFGNDVVGTNLLNFVSVSNASTNIVVNNIDDLRKAITLGVQKIIITAGTYTFTSAITISNPMSIIANPGVIFSGNSLSPYFNVSANNCTINGIEIDGTGQSAVVGLIRSFATVTNLKIINCTFSNCGTGTEFVTNTKLTIKNCNFSNITVPINLTSSDNVIINQCLFESCNFVKFTTSGDKIKITDNTFDTILSSNPNNISISNLIMNGNIFDNFGNIIFRCTNSIISSNNFNTTSISFFTIDDTTISGNVFESNATSGTPLGAIQLTSGAGIGKVTISSNSFTNVNEMIKFPSFSGASPSIDILNNDVQLVTAGTLPTFCDFNSTNSLPTSGYLHFEGNSCILVNTTQSIFREIDTSDLTSTNFILGKNKFVRQLGTLTDSTNQAGDAPTGTGTYANSLSSIFTGSGTPNFNTIFSVGDVFIFRDSTCKVSSIDSSTQVTTENNAGLIKDPSTAAEISFLNSSTLNRLDYFADDVYITIPTLAGADTKYCWIRIDDLNEASVGHILNVHYTFTSVGDNFFIIPTTYKSDGDDNYGIRVPQYSNSTGMISLIWDGSQWSRYNPLQFWQSTIFTFDTSGTGFVFGEYASDYSISNNPCYAVTPHARMIIWGYHIGYDADTSSSYNGDIAIFITDAATGGTRISFIDTVANKNPVIGTATGAGTPISAALSHVYRLDTDPSTRLIPAGEAIQIRFRWATAPDPEKEITIIIIGQYV